MTEENDVFLNDDDFLSHSSKTLDEEEDSDTDKDEKGKGEDIEDEEDGEPPLDFEKEEVEEV